MRYPLFILIAVSLVIAAHWTLTRNPCLKTLQGAQTAWGQGAWHGGMGDCPAKPWWRP